MRLELAGCTKRYAAGNGSTVSVLDGASAVFESGKTYAIVGRSGSGKSTLLNVLGLLTNPSDGDYLIDGITSRALNERRRSALRGQRFGFIFQDFVLAAHKTALENVALPLTFGERQPYRRRRTRGMELLDLVGLSDHAHRFPWQLSGGQQQRVAIARALIGQPLMLLGDEPTGSLDQETGADTLALLLELVGERGAGLIIVTHDPLIAETADQRLELTDGRLGRPEPAARGAV
jgi:putative ABC transport system ATP-binding protein